MRRVARVPGGWLAQKLLPTRASARPRLTPQEDEEVAQAYAEVVRITNERLSQARRIWQALERGAPEAEVQAEQQQYRQKLEGWNAALKVPLAVLSDKGPGWLLLSDELFSQEYLAGASGPWIRAHRLKAMPRGFLKRVHDLIGWAQGGLAKGPGGSTPQG